MNHAFTKIRRPNIYQTVHLEIGPITKATYTHIVLVHTVKGNRQIGNNPISAIAGGTGCPLNEYIQMKAPITL